MQFGSISSIMRALLRWTQGNRFELVVRENTTMPVNVTVHIIIPANDLHVQAHN